MEESLVREIADRKSVTNWSDREVSRAAWDVLFEAARRAPSSWNHQPCRYVAVTDSEAKRALCDALHRCNAWAGKAAGFVVQAARPEDDDTVDGKPYYLYDCGLAMMSLVYQAQVMGLSVRQMIGWDEGAIQRILQIPSEYRIVVIAGLGYPREDAVSVAAAEMKRRLTSQHKRFGMEHVVSWQTWGGVLVE